MGWLRRILTRNGDLRAAGARRQPTPHLLPPNGGVDYATLMDPLAVRNVAVGLVAPLANGGFWNLHQVAALFTFTRHAIAYVSDPTSPDIAAHPLDTLESGGGNCEAKSLLFTSMCEAVGISTRLVLAHSLRLGYSHLIAEVCAATISDDQLGRDLASYYAGRADVSRGFHREIVEGNQWILADVACGEYLGDVAYLLRYGFAQGGNALWTWTQPPTYYRYCPVRLDALRAS